MVASRGGRLRAPTRREVCRNHARGRLPTGGHRPVRGALRSEAHRPAAREGGRRPGLARFARGSCRAAEACRRRRVPRGGAASAASSREGLARSLRAPSEGTPYNRKSPAVRRSCSEGAFWRSSGRKVWESKEAVGGRHRGSWRATSGSRPRRRKRARPSRPRRSSPGPSLRGGDSGAGGTAQRLGKGPRRPAPRPLGPPPRRDAVKRVSTGEAPKGLGPAEDETGATRDVGVRL